jgi:hypothetical protein
MAPSGTGQLTGYSLDCEEKLSNNFAMGILLIKIIEKRALNILQITL